MNLKMSNNLGNHKKNMDAPLFMASKWDLEYHVHTNAINLVVGAMVIQNLIKM
jgi:hypothetical protein